MYACSKKINLYLLQFDLKLKLTYRFVVRMSLNRTEFIFGFVETTIYWVLTNRNTYRPAKVKKKKTLCLHNKHINAKKTLKKNVFCYPCGREQVFSLNGWIHYGVSLYYIELTYRKKNLACVVLAVLAGCSDYSL